MELFHSMDVSKHVILLKSIIFWDMTTWCHIPEDDTLHNHRCENLKSYM
jgi:hypothetical protein